MNSRCGLSAITIILCLAMMLCFYAPARAAEWPRQITDSRGTQTISRPPQRIVSTSVTLTGSLLAIDAPVVASSATTPGNRFADSQGFLRQWSNEAKARHLSRMYIGAPNAESVAAQMPDLILVSATGGDSALALYDQLAVIAPTLVINYDDKSWQQILILLGQATGHEQQAAQRIAEFTDRQTRLRQQLRLPPQPVSALVYNPAAHTTNLWTTDSAQGQLLQQLGFTLAPLPAGLHTSQSMGQRRDIIQLSGENMAAGLNGQTLLLFASDDNDAGALRHDPLLQHLPAVQQWQVYALGSENFRLDYYSASQLLTRLTQLFPPSPITD